MDTKKEDNNFGKTSPKTISITSEVVEQNLPKNEFNSIGEIIENIPSKIKMTHQFTESSRNVIEMSNDTKTSLEVIEEVDEKDYISDQTSDEESELKKPYIPLSKKSSECRSSPNRRFVIACVDTAFNPSNYSSEEELLSNDKTNLLRHNQNVNEHGNSFMIGGVQFNTETLLPIPLEDCLEEDPVESKVTTKRNNDKNKGFFRSFFQSSFLNCFGLRSQQRSVGRAIIRQQNSIFDDESQIMRPF